MFTPQIQVPTKSGHIRPKRLEDLINKENNTETATIENDEPENFVVDLDPAQLLLGMFDDAPEPELIPFDASNETVIIEFLMLMFKSVILIW